MSVSSLRIIRPNTFTRRVAASAAAVSVLVLLGVTLPPARAADAGAAASRRSSVAGADVLFWARADSVNGGFSIVKAAAARPALIATVLSASVSPYGTFSAPEASPDGTRLAYIRKSAETWSLEVRVLSTGATTVLASETNAGLQYYNLLEPTWSPDGNTIAYGDVGVQGNVYAQVRVVAAAGGPYRIVDSSAAIAAWRPDGRLTVIRSGTSGGASSGIWVTGATPADAVLIPGSAGARTHAWSPDGAQIAFETGDGSIATLPAAGGTPTVIAPAPELVENTSPAWSSDGQSVYFSAVQVLGAPDNAPAAIKRVSHIGGVASTVIADWTNLQPSVSDNAPAPIASKSHDFNGDGYADVIGRTTSGDLRLYYGNGAALSGSKLIGIGWGSLTAIFSPGDFNGDGKPDVIGRTSTGDLRLYYGTGTGLAGSTLIGTGFGPFTALFSPGDFNGDGLPDVIGRTTSGDLRLYYGTGAALSGSKQIGIGWGSLTAVFSPGDFNGDGKPDVIGRTPTGDLRLYYGTGTGLAGSTLIGTGFGSLTALFSPGDFNLDGLPDVVGRTSTGDLRVYYGNGSRLSGSRLIGIGWNGINAFA